MSQHPILKVPSAQPAAVNSPLPNMVEAGEPWNVLREKAGLAAGMNTYVETKTEFDGNFPQAAPKQDTPPQPKIAPISAGARITPDETNYVIDRSAAVNTERRRRY